MITQTAIINLIPSSVSPVIHVSQYDVGRVISLTILNGVTPFIFGSGQTAIVNGRKPDKTVFTYDASISNNIVSFTTTQQMLAVAGKVLTEIRIQDGNGNDIGTANFILDVENAPIDENAIYSESDIPAIEQAAANIGQAKDAASQAKASETNAKSYKDQSAISAASAEDDANLASDYLNSIKALMDDASAVQDFVENYADIIKDIGQQYPVDEYVLDSSGNQILDNFGLPIESRTYESATKHAIRDAESALSLAESVEARVTKLEAWKDSIWLYPHDNALLDSSGSAILDSDGNAIGGQVMLLAI